MSFRRMISARASMRWLAFGLALAAMGAAPSIAQATTSYMVTNTSNDPNTVNSLPWAIDQSNANGPGPNTIDFNISGSGIQTISPSSGLIITTPVLIDGTTQSGYSGTPLIQLDGTSAGSGANGLTITAGSTTVKGLEITHWSGAGIVLSGAGHDTISRDYIGTDGGSSFPNGTGISVSSAQNTIGGTLSGAGNVISGNHAFGLYIVGAGAKSNVVEGNEIGTESGGTAAVPNGVAGIFVAGKATGNTIGGVVTGARNLVSGNALDGIDVTGAGTSSNKVQGNFVGTDGSGAVALANGNEGVAVFGGATKNIVGGASAAARNVVSGNAKDGVAVNGKGTTGNHVEGNYIGINAAGTAALGNGGIGAPVFEGATGNTVGGTTAGARNVISGNLYYGVSLVSAGTSHNVVEGNYIGTNPSGTAAIPNKIGGVQIYDQATHNVVGGASPKARNVISGNGSSGVGIHDKGTSANVVEGNFIGTNAAGTGPLGNSLDGVLINLGASGNVIGGTAPGTGNRIADNTPDGVRVSGKPAKGNVIERNSIYGSAKKVGIALTSGGNGDQAAPAILKVTTSRSSTKVTVDDKAAGHYRVELFSNPSCGDPEGRVYLGAVTLSGGAYTLTLSKKLPAHEGVTATATNDTTHNTSRFSACRAVP